MAISTTFGALKTNLGLYAVRGNTAFTNLLPNFIRTAQDEMNGDPEFRFKFMEASVDLVFKKSVTASTVGGTANAITLTRPTSDTVSAYALGQRDAFTAGSTNTGATTVAIDGQAVTSVRKNDGSSTLGPLEANDIVSGHDYELYYDGSIFRLLPAPGAVPLPSRYLGMRTLYLDATTRRVLHPLPPEYFHAQSSVNVSTEPQGYAVMGEYLVVGSVDQAYAGKALYWRGLAAFTDDANTDWVLTNRPYLYESKCLAVIFRQLGEIGKAATYEAIYADQRDQLKAAEMRDRYGATPQAKSSVNAY